MLTILERILYNYPTPPRIVDQIITIINQASHFYCPLKNSKSVKHYLPLSFNHINMQLPVTMFNIDENKVQLRNVTPAEILHFHGESGLILS